MCLENSSDDPLAFPPMICLHDSVFFTCGQPSARGGAQGNWQFRENRFGMLPLFALLFDFRGSFFSRDDIVCARRFR